jgi:hypothetical protein
MRVPEPAGLRQCLFHPGPRSIDVAQVQQGHGEVREHLGERVGQFPTDDAMRRTSKIKALLQERAGRNEFPEVPAGPPFCAKT